MERFTRSKARSGSARPTIARLMMFAAAGAIVFVGAKRLGAMDQSRFGPQLTRIQQWLRSFAKRWLSRMESPPLLETESRAGKDVLRAQPEPFDTHAVARPTVESEPRSGVKVML